MGQGLRSQGQAGADLSKQLLQPADTHGDVGEGALVLQPHLAQLPGDQGQQVQHQGLHRHAALAHRHDAGPGGAIVRQQHEADQLPDLARAHGPAGELGQLGLRRRCGMGPDQAGNDALLQGTGQGGQVGSACRDRTFG